jgi:hypothetical protein
MITAGNKISSKEGGDRCHLAMDLALVVIAKKEYNKTMIMMMLCLLRVEM